MWLGEFEPAATLLLDRTVQRRIDRPGVVQPPCDNTGFDASDFCPFSECQCSPAESDEAVSPDVSRLSVFCGPATVCRGVGTIVVDAINGMPERRATSHISDEVLEGMEPAITDGDSATSIVGIGTIALVKTPLFQISPGDPLGSDLSSSCFSVFRLVLPGAFDSVASATDASAVAQGISINGLFHSTCASAKPSAVPQVTQRFPTTELPISHVDEGWHTQEVYNIA